MLCPIVALQLSYQPLYSASSILRAPQILRAREGVRNTSHIFRDINVSGAFPEAALLGETLVKAMKMSIFSKIAP